MQIMSAPSRVKLWVLFLLLPLSVFADERILLFHSDIDVHEDARMTVTETIRVRAENRGINRGIYRDFPTRYRDRHRNRITVDFEVLSVTRDGAAEPYHLEKISNGTRVKIGRADVVIPLGDYTYAITYRTNRQLGFFDEFDELYWNVTGNGWGFPIDAASALVTLPASVPPDSVRTEGYTGMKGSKAGDFEARAAGEGTSVIFEATHRLLPGEGLTIVVSWPKGHVAEPTEKQQWAWFIRDNASAAAALIGLILVFSYYLVVWLMVGVDPARGTVIPRFRPPEKLSPGAARFVWKMGYDHRCFAAALIHLAVRGQITLEEKDGVYTVRRGEGGKGDGFQEEEKLLSKLLGTRGALPLSQTNHRVIGKALKSLKTSLAASHEKRHFLLNKKYWFFGIALLLASWIAVVLLGREPALAGFLSLWLAGWSIGVIVLVRMVVGLWTGVVTGPNRAGQAVGALFMTAFATPFVIGECFGLYQMSVAVTPLAVLVMTVAVLAVIVFYHLLKAPTLLGRRLLDELEGFRLYLSVAERDRLSAMRSPEKTPDLFEAFLPYALALDVEQQWAEQFAEVLAEAGAAGTATYRPAWYDTTSGHALGAAALAGAVGGALTSAISSSSTAPGSSSGSGGGGSSGGGGGGGGGGGW